MEELIEKLRNAYLEKDQVIESQKREVEVARVQVSNTNQEVAVLKGQLIECHSKLKRFNQLMKEVDKDETSTQ